MKILVFLFFSYVFAIPDETTPSNPRSVNLALETVLEFDKKDHTVDLKFIDNVQRFLTRVKSVINNNAFYRRSSNHRLTLSDFLENAIIILNSYNDVDLEDVFAVIDDELRKFHYKGCKFYELFKDHDVRRFVSKKLEELKNTPAADIRRTLSYVLSALQNREYSEHERKLIDFLNTLYGTDSTRKLTKFLNDLQMYKAKSQRSTIHLIKVIRHGIRSIIFDHYSSLNTNARRELKINFENYWKQYNHSKKFFMKMLQSDFKRKNKESITDNSAELLSFEKVTDHEMKTDTVRKKKKLTTRTPLQMIEISTATPLKMVEITTRRTKAPKKKSKRTSKGKEREKKDERKSEGKGEKIKKKSKRRGHKQKSTTKNKKKDREIKNDKKAIVSKESTTTDLGFDKHVTNPENNLEELRVTQGIYEEIFTKKHRKSKNTSSKSKLTTERSSLKSKKGFKVRSKINKEPDEKQNSIQTLWEEFYTTKQVKPVWRIQKFVPITEIITVHNANINVSNVASLYKTINSGLYSPHQTEGRDGNNRPKRPRTKESTIHSDYRPNRESKITVSYNENSKVKKTSRFARDKSKRVHSRQKTNKEVMKLHDVTEEDVIHHHRARTSTKKYKELGTKKQIRKRTKTSEEGLPIESPEAVFYRKRNSNDTMTQKQKKKVKGKFKKKKTRNADVDKNKKNNLAKIKEKETTKVTITSNTTLKKTATNQDNIERGIPLEIGNKTTRNIAMESTTKNSVRRYDILDFWEGTTRSTTKLKTTKTVHKSSNIKKLVSLSQEVNDTIDKYKKPVILKTIPYTSLFIDVPVNLTKRAYSKPSLKVVNIDGTAKNLTATNQPVTVTTEKLLFKQIKMNVSNIDRTLNSTRNDMDNKIEVETHIFNNTENKLNDMLIETSSPVVPDTGVTVINNISSINLTYFKNYKL